MRMRGQQDVPDWWLEGRKLFHCKLQRNTLQWTVIVKTGTRTHFYFLRRKHPSVFNLHLSDRLTYGKAMTRQYPSPWTQSIRWSPCLDLLGLREVRSHSSEGVALSGEVNKAEIKPELQATLNSILSLLWLL